MPKPAPNTGPALNLADLAAAAVPSTMDRVPNNPFIGTLRESYEADTAGQNGIMELPPVRGDQVKRVIYALRSAADYLATEGIGLRLRYQWADDSGEVQEGTDDGAVPTDDRPVIVKYLGRTRKEYLTKAERQHAIELGLILRDEDGEPVLNSKGDGPRADRDAYRAWQKQHAVASVEEDEGEEYDEDEIDDSDLDTGE
jgi:hypothetical protein